MAEIEKIRIVMHLEVKRSGRRTYVNIPDLEVKTCRISPGDILTVNVTEIRRQEDVGLSE